MKNYEIRDLSLSHDENLGGCISKDLDNGLIESVLGDNLGVVRNREKENK